MYVRSVQYTYSYQVADQRRVPTPSTLTLVHADMGGLEQYVFAGVAVSRRAVYRTNYGVATNKNDKA